MLEIRGLGYQRDRIKLFSNLTFNLLKGERLLIIGSNGSGKTSLLKILCGLNQPMTGEIKRTCQFIYIGHNSGFNLKLTPIENLEWWCAIQGRKLFHSNIQNNIEKILDLIGIGEKRHQPCHQLSKGLMQRISLSRLLLLSAPLWIMDEPFNSIDEESKAFFKKNISTHLNRGGAVVLATHDVQDIHTRQDDKVNCDTLIPKIQRIRLGVENEKQWEMSITNDEL